MSHPIFSVLLDYLEEKLPPTERAEVDQHLAAACSVCALTLARLEKVVRAMQTDRTTAPPRAFLRQAAKAAWQKKTAPARLQLPSLLVFDNYRQASFAAVRGVSEARQLLFTTEQFDIDVQITPTEDHLALVGQILGNEQTGASNAPAAVARLRQGAETLDRAEIDQVGQFAFAPFPVGAYQLVIELENQEIAVALNW